MKHVLPSRTIAAPIRPSAKLAMAGLALAPLALALGWTLSPAGLPMSLAVLLLGFALATRAMDMHYRHPTLGACNGITALRLSLTAALAAAIFGTGAQWGVFAIASLALALDGVDGWLARRSGLASAFGARFDMEVDSALAATLALLAFASGRGGTELIVLGGARYLFLAASVVWPWLAAPLSESLRRKTICVVQVGTLAALTLPILPDPAARAMAIAAAVLLAWSFWRDVRTLKARA